MAGIPKAKGLGSNVLAIKKCCPALSLSAKEAPSFTPVWGWEWGGISLFILVFPEKSDLKGWAKKSKKSVSILFGMYSFYRTLMPNQNSSLEKPKGHKPVLVKEVLSLAPFSPPGEGKQMWDATFGCGGHTKAFLDRFPKLSVTAIDRDLQAIKWGKKHILPFLPQNSVQLYHNSFHPFSNLIEKGILPKQAFFDVILLDLGVSSLQLDQAKRGFSFYKDGPLDMRMDQSQTLSAKDIINQCSAPELNNVFFQSRGFSTIPKGHDFSATDFSATDFFTTYKSKHLSPLKSKSAEKFKCHRYTKRVIKAILKEREKKPIESTKELADLIVKQVGWRKKGQHPATAFFLALRLKVNEELASLEPSLPSMIQSLKAGGRLLVLSFHSAEDRIVKQAFKKAKENKKGQALKKKFFPTQEEIKQNPRARSAKLRAFERGS